MSTTGLVARAAAAAIAAGAIAWFAPMWVGWLIFAPSAIVWLACRWLAPRRRHLRKGTR